MKTPSMGRICRSEQGIVLLVALIVLVSMSLAGVALIRSVDNTVVVAGNLAFKQASVQVADYGTQQAITWLWQNRLGATLQNSITTQGYYSARPPSEPDWSDDATWQDAVFPNGAMPDASGNVVRYVIHRMCVLPNLDWGGVNQECALYFPRSGATAGGSRSVGYQAYEGIPQLYFRVTTRVDGPRNSITIIQTSVLL